MRAGFGLAGSKALYLFICLAHHLMVMREHRLLVEEKVSRIAHLGKVFPALDPLLT